MERVFRPNTLAELEDILRGYPAELTFVAGATDLMVQKPVWNRASNLVDLTAVQELHEQIEVTADRVVIGAAVPLSRIIGHPLLQQRLPILIAACRQIGSVQIQNRATLGGNIANASPAGDSLPVLSVLDAKLWLGPRKNGEFDQRSIAQIMLNPGETTLRDNRYIAFIQIPVPESENQFWYFRKVGQRQALAISKVSLAALGWLRDGIIEEIRIAAGSVSPRIVRARTTEMLLKRQLLTELLIDAAARAIKEDVAPISDIRSTADYRRQICGELLREALFNFLPSANV